MSVVAADIVVYGSAVMAEDDSTGSQGGAIDLTKKMTFTDIAATDQVTVISDNAGDTSQTVTIYGRNAAGSIVNEGLALDGTNRVTGAVAFERILKVVVSGTHTGTITVTRDNTPTFTVIGTLLGTAAAVGGTAELEFRRPFYNVSANSAGSSEKAYYEKVFVKNNNATNALLSAVISESADGVDTGATEVNTGITFDLEDAVNDNNTSANRVSAPSGMLGTFTSAAKNVVGTDLGTSSAQGVWLKLNLDDGEVPGDYTYTLGVSGNTT